MQTNHAKTTGVDSGNAVINTDLRISQLSTGENKPRSVIAVFAYNNAKTIQAALKSILAATDNHDVSIYVLANGCTDTTIDKVRDCLALMPNLWLVEIPEADKASAWNIFIHDLFPEEEAIDLKTWFFMDGDVTLAPNSMPILATMLDNSQNAEAVGGMPGSGRDMDARRQRMVNNGVLAGNYYALRGSFVQQVRNAQIRLPVGLIGEEFLLSWMIANILWWDTEPERRSRCVFSGSAEFMFRSLSPLSLPDYKTFLHRKWRYTIRGFQHQMLIMLLMKEGLASMPSTVEELYSRVPPPTYLKWAGIIQTPLNLLVGLKIRSFREMS